VGQIVERMMNKSKGDDHSLIPGTKLVLYSAVSVHAVVHIAHTNILTQCKF